VKQKQLDIYGELMDAALKLSNYVGKIDAELWPFLRNVVDYAADHWQDRDYGIWEIRGGPHNFVYSKVMCWVALDRGITIARRYGFHADLNRWEHTLSCIKDQVLEKGWSSARQSFVQHYETDALDASSLLIPLVGFLPFDDHRVVSTVDATWEALSSQGYLYRYISEDGLAGGEGTFLLCTFWMVNCLIGLNRLDEAEALLGRLEAVANHLGLFSEEYDTLTGEQLGNFPQAFTHIGYINCVSELIKARSHARPVQQRRPTARKFFFKTVLLNDGKPSDAVCATDVGSRLKESMNIMRGAFFDTEKGRIAYERIKDSNVYKQHEVLSYGLKQADLLCLRTREEAIAFWVNLYNVIVIHGVVELGIRDSVKEVRNFFRRVQYQIGDMFFNPDDIEHGILRGNRPPPNALFKQFGNKDKRNAYSITPIDPRIHFALVCASSSCPPIAVYTAEKLDKELTIAGESFLNGGGLQVKRDINSVSLSRIFKWYGGDFGKSTAEMLRFVARFVYDAADREFLFQHADTVTVTYQDYDWGLNRY
jgi:hypothetical protein